MEKTEGRKDSKEQSRDDGSRTLPESGQGGQEEAGSPGQQPADAEQHPGQEEPSCQEVMLCQVRLRPEAYPVTYLVGGLELTEGEWVVVPTDHGREVGQVVKRPYMARLQQDKLPQAVERLATTSEIEDYYRNLDRERSAWQICQRLCDSLGLNMKLVRVERFFDGSKIVFYYSADGRVDFRELVKGLVRELRMRVEMRQIGIRHEAKMIGGIGCCGRELCCASFLKAFDPISIKMAKAQNLPLNPSKISGFCGRLLCCLTFEYDTYKELAQDMPALGKACRTPDGQGKVIRHNIFKQAVTVMMPDGSFVEYQIGELNGTAGPGDKKEGRDEGPASESEPSGKGQEEKGPRGRKTGGKGRKQKGGQKASGQRRTDQKHSGNKGGAQKRSGQQPTKRRRRGGKKGRKGGAQEAGSPSGEGSAGGKEG